MADWRLHCGPVRELVQPRIVPDREARQQSEVQPLCFISNVIHAFHKLSNPLDDQCQRCGLILPKEWSYTVTEDESVGRQIQEGSTSQASPHPEKDTSATSLKENAHVVLFNPGNTQMVLALTFEP